MSSGKKIHVEADAPSIAKRAHDDSEGQGAVDLTPRGVQQGPAQRYIAEMAKVSSTARDTYRELHGGVRNTLRNVSEALADLLEKDQELADDLKMHIAALDEQADLEEQTPPARGVEDAAGRGPSAYGTWAE